MSDTPNVEQATAAPGEKRVVAAASAIGSALADFIDKAAPVAEKIIRAVAESDPVDDDGYETFCAVCEGHGPSRGNPHVTGCAFVLAKQWVAEHA